VCSSDLGGNCGMYVRQYAKLFDTVWAFEPSPVPFHCMVNNSTYDNVVKMQIALGDENTMISMNTATENSHVFNVAIHTVDRYSKDSIIPMMTIDSFNFPSCSFMQLDVEGFEINILRGAEKTIDKYRPVIAAENGFYGFVLDFLTNKNYKLLEKSRSDGILVPEENLNGTV